MRFKRLLVPIGWPIEKKTNPFTFAIKPGPHAKKNCITLGVLLRDVLKLVENSGELKQLLNSRQVKIDGRVRREPGFPLGLMDVITIEKNNWRLVPEKKGFRLISLSSGESNTKLLKVTKKICVKKGRYQIGSHDGRTLLIDKNQFDKIKTGDVLVYKLDKNSIESVISLAK